MRTVFPRPGYTEWAEDEQLPDSNTLNLLAADAILVLHVCFVGFVVFGLLLLFPGRWLGWRWIRNAWFRLSHLAAIAVVVAQSWLGVICPLTIWEMQLREKAGDAYYEGAFIAHWVDELLYYQAPPWVFMLCYTVFGLLVLISWFWARPRSFAA